MFPVGNRAVIFEADSINGGGDDKLFTRFGSEHRWCDATFSYQTSGPHIWGKFYFYGDNEKSSRCCDWESWETFVKENTK